MRNLAYRHQKIQEKRKITPWRTYVKELASWFPLVLQRDGKKVTRYPVDVRYRNLFYAHDQDISSYVHDFNAQESFFQQLGTFWEDIPKLGNLNFPTSENCDFAEGVFGGKNCYLSMDVGEGVEHILYSAIVLVQCRNIFNSINVNTHCENIYHSKSISQSSNIYYSKQVSGSFQLWFCKNMIGCSECVLCTDLENKKYCIANVQYEKEEYFNRKNEWLENKRSFFEETYRSLNKPERIINSTDCSGSGLVSCNTIENGHALLRFSEGRNLMLGEGGNVSSRCYDGFYIGTDIEDFYGMVSSGINASDCYCSVWITRCSYIYYSYYLDNCSYCLGCMGLRNKSFYIFNKAYTKDEWHEQVHEIFQQMQTEGILGDFFPGSMNPFYFNDTAAYLIDDSFTKEEVVTEGYLRRDEKIQVDIPAGVEIVQVNDLGGYESRTEGEQDIDSSILKKVICDEEGNYYRIVKSEYDFLSKHNLPLPRQHWLERLKSHFKIW